MKSSALSTPMFELISISIHVEGNCSWRPEKAYGRVWVENAEGTFDFYRRNNKYPEFLDNQACSSLSGHNLVLSNPTRSVVLASSPLNLLVDLTVKASHSSTSDCLISRRNDGSMYAGSSPGLIGYSTLDSSGGRQLSRRNDGSIYAGSSPSLIGYIPIDISGPQSSIRNDKDQTVTRTSRSINDYRNLEFRHQSLIRNDRYMDQGVITMSENRDICLIHARLEWAIFPFAVAATVDVFYLSKNRIAKVHTIPESVNDSDEHDNSDYDYDDCNEDGLKGDTNAHVFGSVIAEFENQLSGKRVLNSKGEGVRKGEKNEACFSIWLLNKKPEKRLSVRCGGSLKLGRNVLAVPSYSRLKIHINLTDHNNVITCGTADFKPHDMLSFKKDIIGENGRFRVRLTWDHGYNIQQAVSNLPLSALSISGSLPPVLHSREEFHLSLVEVFSVGVFSTNRSSCIVHGKIKVYDGKFFPVFDKDENSAVPCSHFETLSSIIGPSRFISPLDEFAITSDLTDEKGGVISLGHVSWRVEHLEFLKLFDKRVCSVIRGKSGFSAIHYSIFRDAIPCRVTVSLNQPSCTKLVGTVVAKYGSWSYPTAYDELFYQSRLFEGVVVLKNDCYGPAHVVPVPLSKSLVSAPRKSSLIITVDLTASDASDVDDPLYRRFRSRLTGTLMFEPGGSESEQRIKEGKYCLRVTVGLPHDFV